MKVGWKTKRLDEVCVLRPPKSEAREKLTNNDLVSFAPMDELGIDRKYLNPKGARSLSDVIGSYTYFANGDVLLAKITPCFENGKLGIARDLINGIGFGSSEYFVIRPSDELSADFLYYFLLQPSFRENATKSMTGAVGHKRVAKEFLESLLLPIPPLPEQQRIVTILDEAFEAIAAARANANQNRSNARALFESVLNSVSGENEALGDYVTIKTGKLDSNAAVEGGKYPFFTCAKEIYAIDNFAFDCEAILLAGNNAVGDFNVKHYRGKFNAYQRTYVITINNEDRLHYRFLYFQMLKSLKRFKEQSVGAGTKFLKLGMIESLEISLPSLEEQNRLVLKLDSVLEETQRLDYLYQRKIAALDELKQSLLQQAFSGLLDTTRLEASQ